jgi:HlyD family secretion protein
LKKILAIAAGVVVLAAIVAFSVRAGGREKGTRVYAETPIRQRIARVVKASGQIDPRIKVNLSAHVIGKIAKLFVREGDSVVAGQPFLQLEREAFVAIERASAGSRVAPRSRLRQAEIALSDGDLKLQRMKRLTEESIASTEQLEGAELQHHAAQQAVEQARQAVLQAQADLTKARDDLAKTTIYSPLAGKVIALNAEEGEVVVSGTMNNPGSVIGTVADLSEILVEVDVDENEIVWVRQGQPAIAHVDAVADRSYRGSVVEIGSSGYTKPQQPDVKFFRVKILLERPDEALRAGMSARTEIETESKDQALVVPIQAVVERVPLLDGKPAPASAKRDEVKVVFTIDKGKARQREVVTGISDATYVELVSGVAETDRVANGPYRSLKSLKEGGAVRIVKESEDREKKTAQQEKEDGKN